MAAKERTFHARQPVIRVGVFAEVAEVAGEAEVVVEAPLPDDN